MFSIHFHEIFDFTLQFVASVDRSCGGKSRHNSSMTKSNLLCLQVPTVETVETPEWTPCTLCHLHWSCLSNPSHVSLFALKLSKIFVQWPSGTLVAMSLCSGSLWSFQNVKMPEELKPGQSGSPFNWQISNDSETMQQYLALTTRALCTKTLILERLGKILYKLK